MYRNVLRFAALDAAPVPDPEPYPSRHAATGSLLSRSIAGESE